MKIYFLSILILLTLSCTSEKPKICEIKSRFDRMILTREYSNCGIEKLEITDAKSLKFIYQEICKAKSRFILSKQGDLWYINMYIDVFDKKLFSLTRTADGELYFRDNQGTYSNDELAKFFISLMEIECKN